MSKVSTISYGSVKAYATVPARLKQFREQNPRASITTTPTFGEDGSLLFKAEIVVDKSDPSSATATGHAHYAANELSKAKAFEKLETIATGRALSLLGYLNNGDVASTEEMLEFEEFQLGAIKEKITAAKTQKDFLAIMNDLKPDQKLEVTPLINERIEELKNAKATK